MGMFDLTMSDEQAAKFRTQLEEAVRDHLGAEELVAVGAFRRGGASQSFAASKAGGGLVYAAVALGRKKRAGGLPDKVALAVTPERLHAYKLKIGRKGCVAEKEVAVWERAGLRVGSEQRGGMTNVTIASPAEDEQVTLVPIGVRDDPVALEVIGVLEQAHPAAPA